MMVARKRSITISGHRTSFSLEDAFFDEIVRLAENQKLSLAAFVATVDSDRPRDTNLSSALRLEVLRAAKAGELV